MNAVPHLALGLQVLGALSAAIAVSGVLSFTYDTFLRCGVSVGIRRQLSHVHAHELHPTDSLKSSERRRARGRVSDCWNTDFFSTPSFVPNTGESVGLTVRGVA